MDDADRNTDWDPGRNAELVDRIRNPQTSQDWSLRKRYDSGDAALRSAADRQYQARARKGEFAPRVPLNPLVALPVLIVFLLVLAVLVF